MSFNFRLALRYLFSPNKSSFSSTASWLAIGGLSIGITALMLTASIIHGFQKVISDTSSSDAYPQYAKNQKILQFGHKTAFWVS